PTVSASALGVNRSYRALTAITLTNSTTAKRLRCQAARSKNSRKSKRPHFTVDSYPPAAPCSGRERVTRSVRREAEKPSRAVAGAGRLGPDDDAAAVGRELDRVGEQVVEDLLHLALILVQLGQAGADIDGEVEVLLFHERPGHVALGVQHVVDAEIAEADFHL